MHQVCPNLRRNFLLFVYLIISIFRILQEKGCVCSFFFSCGNAASSHAQRCCSVGSVRLSGSSAVSSHSLLFRSLEQNLGLGPSSCLQHEPRSCQTRVCRGPRRIQKHKKVFFAFFFFFFFFCESQFYLTFVLCFLSLQRAIITINKAGVIVSCNNAARFLFGYPLGLMVGGRVERLMAPSFAASHQSHVDAAAAQTAQGTFTGKWKLKEAVGLNLII